MEPSNSLGKEIFVLSDWQRDCHMCFRRQAGSGWGALPSTKHSHHPPQWCKGVGLLFERVTKVMVNMEAGRFKAGGGSLVCTLVHCLQTPFCSQWD